MHKGIQEFGDSMISNSKLKQESDSLFFSVRSTNHNKLLSREDAMVRDLLDVNKYVEED